MLTFAKLRDASDARTTEWSNGDRNLFDLSFYGNELAGEVGEACNIIKKLERERLGAKGSRATKQDLADELADVVICADLIANKAGFDLGAAVERKFNATSEKNGFKTKIESPTSNSINWAKQILSEAGYTAVKTKEIRHITISEHINEITCLQVRDLDDLVEHFKCSMSMQLGRKLLEDGALQVWDRTELSVIGGRTIRLMATVIEP